MSGGMIDPPAATVAAGTGAMPSGASAPAPTHPAWVFAVFFAVYFAVWTVRATIGFDIDRALDQPFSWIYSNAVKFALWAVPAAAFAYWVRGESRLASLRLGAPSLRSLPLTIAIIVAYLMGVAWDVARKRGMELSTFGAALAQRGVGPFAAGLPSAFSEEVFFRGLVLTELAERMPFWRANLLSGVLFVAMHWPNRIWRLGWTGAVFADAPALLLIALALGYVTRRSGSIWPGVLFHAANNALTAVAS
jgi:membrane protease YdiL (CAAX protease family)